jgi:hypothetical protein
MAFTYQNVIDEALQILGVMEPGATLSSAQYADLLRSLVMMLGEWNAQEGLQNTLTAEAFALVPNKIQYSIGPPGVTPPDWSSAYRPTQILQANVIWGSGGSAVRVPLHIESAFDYTAQNPVTQVGVPYPQKVYFQNSYNTDGYAQLLFYPTPSQTLFVELVYAGETFKTNVAISDAILLPNLYMRALVYNLATVVAPKFGVPPTGDIIQQAATGLRNIRNYNQSNRPIMRSRESRGGGIYWNWVSGTNERSR